MRLVLLLAFSSLALKGFSQNATDAAPVLPKEPGAILSMAVPFYDFSQPTLKPWHVKTTYQLHDEKGNPSEQGTYDYWWASPKVYRSTWSRNSTTQTDWHTAEGKHVYADADARKVADRAALALSYVLLRP